LIDLFQRLKEEETRNHALIDFFQGLKEEETPPGGTPRRNKISPKYQAESRPTLKYPSEPRPALKYPPEPRPQQQPQIFLLSQLEPEFPARPSLQHFVDYADMKECCAACNILQFLLVFQDFKNFLGTCHSRFFLCLKINLEGIGPEKIKVFRQF
jgi:hypothetical protein